MSLGTCRKKNIPEHRETCLCAFSECQHILKLGKLYDNLKSKFTTDMRGEDTLSNNYSVKLGTCDKITAIKVYREITGAGLSEAKDIIDKTPGVIFKNLSLSEANEIVRKF